MQRGRGIVSDINRESIEVLSSCIALFALKEDSAKVCGL